MDQKDEKIIELLKEDSRRPFTEIAEELGVTEATVRKRVESLEKEGVIQKYTVELDPEKLGYQTVAIVGLDVEPKDLLTASRAISNFEEVKFAATSAGDHMIMFEVWAEDNEHLREFISKKIGDIEGVKDVCPAIMLEKVKY